MQPGGKMPEGRSRQPVNGLYGPERPGRGSALFRERGPVTPPLPRPRTAPPPVAPDVHAPSAPSPRAMGAVLAGLQIRRADAAEQRGKIALFEHEAAQSAMQWPTVVPNSAAARAQAFYGTKVGFVLGTLRSAVWGEHFGSARELPRGVSQAWVLTRAVIHPRLSDPLPLLFRLIERSVADAMTSGAQALLLCAKETHQAGYESMGFREWARPRPAPRSCVFMEARLDDEQLRGRRGALGPMVAKVRRARAPL